MEGLIIGAVAVVIVIVLLTQTIKIVPQARAGIVERFGKYRALLPAGLSVVVPFIDRVRYMIDMREQVVSFPPQGVITEDNLNVSIDTVTYFQVTDPVAATYQIADYIVAIEQLTVTTLRNIIGGMTLEQVLTSRDQINTSLSQVLDEATGKWGIRVNRVELKAIDPPPTIQDSMEKQMRADRDKRAAILTAEGSRQAAILTAEGEKQSAILSAEGQRESKILQAQAEREAQILTAQGEAEAIQTVFQAIHDGRPDQSLLAYQYLQMIPKIADGDANKMWIVPSEIGDALKGLGGAVSGMTGGVPENVDGPRKRIDPSSTRIERDTEAASRAHDAVAEALAAAREASDPRAGKASAKDDGPAAIGPGEFDQPVDAPGSTAVGDESPAGRSVPSGHQPGGDATS